ncbi:Stk1 family PASTA domain-containing Ser/Thr kinase [Solobacterium sp.]|uniref:Stk1 family PASTA domain-containing Ser/Thr kinase n=1 Tax=Solobacterium sp. TaxID=2060878 RepID=UPI001CB085D6|nr:Stk1 family PASTA domain-containing Ser/Thr kinase [Solobacterium sp.]MBF1083611.1 Stk1 family PASTA domain-containing Ser/Thr kinase [Solobacterium sp.]MBF1100286.1 Stk1 family PASTA domain-containing Ser/Thr kinase [Solobacterium sp.]
MNKKNVVANRYEVVQHIGQGGMADVFLAIDTILNRHVAIKILRSDQSTDAISILRFEREAQAATTLAHPNIVEIYDVGEYKNHHYIVMEYVAGKTLKKVIRDRAPLLNLEAVDTMKQLTSAVAEAHKRGIIHRDIKPQNVIVKSDGSLKILDFGIATAKGSAQLTQANNVMGSVHYLAPELAKGEPASPQSDIYALGIVFYEMLTGDVPFKADQAVQIALQHMREPMPSVRKANPNVPQSVENIIIRATAKNPRLRYQSCDEMLKDLEKCMLPEHQNDKPLSLKDPIDKTPTKQEKEDTKVGVTRSTSLSRVANKRTKIYITAILVLFAMFAVIAGLFLAGILPPKSRNVTVPNVSNMDIAQATSALENEDLEVDTDNITYQLSKDSIEGVVIGTEPASSSEVQRHSKVKLIVSSGVGEEMPNYVGKNIDDVKASLPSSIHLIEKEEQSDKKPGTIIRQEGVAAGDLYDTAGETDVTLYYVPYVKVTIPADIIGKPIEEATSQLEAMGITVVRAHRDTSALSQSEIDKIKVGTVIETMPAAGSEYTQKKDSYVTLYFY